MGSQFGIPSSPEHPRGAEMRSGSFWGTCSCSRILQVCCRNSWNSHAQGRAFPEVMAAFWPQVWDSASKTSTNGARVSAMIPQDSREPWWKHPGKIQDNGATFLWGITPGKTFQATLKNFQRNVLCIIRNYFLRFTSSLLFFHVLKENPKLMQNYFNPSLENTYWLLKIINILMK